MPASRPAARGAAGAKPQAAPSDWFEREPRPGSTIVKLGKRMFRRGRASWKIWAVAALVGSGLFAVKKARDPGTFEVAVVLRVSEGQVAQAGGGLGRHMVRAYVKELAFTNARLLGLMSQHPKAFPRIATDPVFAVQDFRENMTVEIAENDFMEDRRQGDPPRSVRMIITYKGSDPELTWQIAQELSALVGGSAMAGQRAALEAELQTANAEAASAADAVTQAEERGAVGPDPLLTSARARLLAAQQRAEDARIGLRGMGEQHVLRFEIVDPGRVPPRPNRVHVVIRAFLVTALLALLAGWLIFGAFDPRVLDDKDLADLGMPLLGRLPQAPSGPAVTPANPPSAPSGAPDPRV